MKHTLLIVFVALLLSACASQGSASYPVLYAQARSEIKIAKEMGFLWRDTEVLLAASQDAYAKRDKKKAMQLVREAIAQARLAQEQAREQANPQVSYPHP
jgi:biopolymer transport protein ExbB/TolQ